jgi:hypothetical protein
MDGMMKVTIIIFLIIVLLISIFNMVRLGVHSNAQLHIPACSDTISLVHHNAEEPPVAATGPVDTLQYKPKSIEPLSCSV